MLTLRPGALLKKLHNCNQIPDSAYHYFKINLRGHGRSQGKHPAILQNYFFDHTDPFFISNLPD